MEFRVVFRTLLVIQREKWFAYTCLKRSIDGILDRIEKMGEVS